MLLSHFEPPEGIHATGASFANGARRLALPTIRDNDHERSLRTLHIVRKDLRARAKRVIASARLRIVQSKALMDNQLKRTALRNPDDGRSLD
jgi:hypothetical protein